MPPLLPQGRPACVPCKAPPCPATQPALLCTPYNKQQALEYQLQQGITDTAKVEACLMPSAARHAYGPEAHCEVGVVRLLQAC